MNCQNFEEVVNDIAREQIMDAGARALAIRHADECTWCAKRLEDERRLTLRLRSLVADTESAAAPTRVEAHVLAAFDEFVQIQSPPQVSARRYQRRYLIGAIAAGLVIMFVVAAITQRSSGWLRANRGALIVAGSPTLPAIAVNGPPPIMERDLSIVPGTKVSARRKVKASTGTRPATAGNSEIATDFLPLTYGAATNLAEGGRMVRVELPHSAMATFGLPVNMDRANERVKADVLLGVDGVAQAIRFVR